MMRVALKRVVVVSAASIVAGVIFNILVTTAIASSGPTLKSAQHQILFGEQRPWPRGVPADWPRHAQTVFVSHRPTHRTRTWMCSVDAMPPARPFEQSLSLELHEFGWPMPALEIQTAKRTLKLPKSGPTDWLSAETVFRRTLLADSFARSLPYIPVWPGFAINTLLYATLLFSLFSTPPLIRRHLRRRRGECPSCGYDVRGILSSCCPECGQ